MSEENKKPETQPEKPQTPAMAQTKQNSLGVPIAIVIAGLLIALAIVFGGNLNSSGSQKTAGVQQLEGVVVEPLSEEDHILGNPNAEVVIVEYSDFDCPFCERFHKTVQLVIDRFGEGGNVAWAYRHFPIEQLHPDADMIAGASECVAELGGNESFWIFTNLIFDERFVEEIEYQGQKRTVKKSDIARLPEFAETSGVDVVAYNACVAEGRYDEAIQDDIQKAVAAGASGTPYSVFIFDKKISKELEVLLTELQANPDYRDRSGKPLINMIEKNQVGMSGAMGDSVIEAIINAQLGIE